MKYKYLLFDLDGTLLDTMEGVVKCAQHALKHFGISATLKELEKFLGPPLRHSFMTLYGLSEEQADEAIRLYRQRYDAVSVNETRVFPEVPELLSKLRKAGYILGVATSKLETQAKMMLTHFGIDGYFEYITGSNLEETISKKHEVIEEALRRFKISDCRENALMIGDMKYDDIGAARVGVDCFGIYTGTAQPNEHEDAGATYIAYSFKELENMLLGDLYN